MRTSSQINILNICFFLSIATSCKILETSIISRNIGFKVLETPMSRPQGRRRPEIQKYAITLAILGNLEIYLPPIAKLPESICIEMSE
jgi:hypothetical protein